MHFGLSSQSKVESPLRFAARFIEFDPASMTVVRGAAGIDGVMIRVEFRGHVLPDALREPALDRLVAILHKAGELRSGHLVRVTRFFLAQNHGQIPCVELGALGSAITQRTLETHEPFTTVQYLEASVVDAWRGFMDTMGIFVREEAAVEIDGRRLVPCLAHVTDLGEAFLSIARRSWGIPISRSSQCSKYSP